MKCSEVQASDCRTLADLMHRLKLMNPPSNFTISEMVVITDGVRWLQNLAQEMAQAYAAQQVKPQAEPSSELKVTKYHPGDLTSE